MSSKRNEVQIFTRVSSIPIVNSALILAFDIYGRIKNYNGLVNATLSTTEHSISYVATATPVCQVTKKLEKQISFADTIACNGLDTLEKKVPSIRKSPKEIKGEAIERVIELKVYGIKQITTMKEVSIQKLYLVMEQPFIIAIREKLVHYMDVIEKTLDDYLPANHEQKESDLQSKELFSRMAFLPTKVQERLHDRYNLLIDKISWK